jgi:hypothetical protein
MTLKIKNNNFVTYRGITTKKNLTVTKSKQKTYAIQNKKLLYFAWSKILFNF